MGVELGQVVYFIDRNPKNGLYFVNFGVVSDIYEDSIYAELYERIVFRLVNGIDSRDIPLVGEWNKLPKHWDKPEVQKKMLNITSRNNLNEEDIISLADIEGLKKAIMDGILVHPSRNDHTSIELDISKYGYRIVKKGSGYGEYHPDGRFLSNTEIYESFGDAFNDLKEIHKEMERQANMTDEEWSLELINHELRRYQDLFDVSDESMGKYSDFFLSLPDIEDVEVRIYSGHLQWKYDETKIWKDLFI